MRNHLSASRNGMSDPPQRQKQFGFTLIELLVAMAIVAILVAFFLPTVRRSRPAAHRVHCKSNLKQIGLALLTYHETYDTLPPAYTVDADGKPLHSWRTLILPFVDQQQLYDKIDLSKPWNDPANSEAYAAEPSVYRCISADLPPNHTAYLSVVTPDSCIRPIESKTLSEITDDHGKTLMVIEVAAEHAVHWMAPQDANEQIVLGLGPETELPHNSGSNAVFVNGSVSFLSSDTTAAVRRAIISIAGNDNETDEAEAAATQ